MPKPKITARYLSARDVAELVGCAKRTVQLAIANGELPVIIIGADPKKPSTYGIAKADARRWRPKPRGRKPSE